MKFAQSKLFFWGVALTVTYVSLGPIIFNIFEHSPEPFMSLGILDHENLTQSYFANYEGIVNINDTNSWHIYIKNNPSKTQYVLLKIKIAGENTDLPDSDSCEPCSSPAIYEMRQVMGKNSTVILPFTWKIIDASKNNGNYVLNKIEINGEEININTSSPANQDLKIVFELWLYDAAKNEFSFNWYSRGDSQCIWNYLRFRSGN